MNPATGRLTTPNMAAAWLLSSGTGLWLLVSSSGGVVTVTVCSGRECIDCVPNSLVRPTHHHSLHGKARTSPPPATATITRTTTAWRHSCCASNDIKIQFNRRLISDLLFSSNVMKVHASTQATPPSLWLVAQPMENNIQSHVLANIMSNYFLPFSLQAFYKQSCRVI